MRRPEGRSIGIHMPWPGSETMAASVARNETKKPRMSAEII